MDPVGLLIIACVAAAGGFISYFVPKVGRRFALASLWALLGLVTGGLALLTLTTPGWDGLVYLVVLVFGCAPAGVGILIGSILGRLHRPVSFD